MGADMSSLGGGDRGCCGGWQNRRSEISVDAIPVVKVSENREKFCRSIAEEGKVETLKSLLQLKQTFDINAADQHGETALHKAARCGRYTSCVALVEAGAEVSVKDKDGRMPVDCAMDAGEHSIADFLARPQQRDSHATGGAMT